MNINSTAPLVDQQQTYGSDQSTRFFLFEYDVDGNATGRLVTGANGGMATWEDIKANALHRGIVLTDQDIFNIPAVGAPLAYHTQTANFKIGTVLTGTLSGATARIVADTDGGAAGTLVLQNISGVFQDNEVITDNTLAYNGQNTNFTVATTVTGATSGATALIVADADGGAAGALTLLNVVGTFQTGEMLNANLAYTGQNVNNFTVGTLVTGATSGATAEIVSDVDNGTTGTLTLKNILGTFQSGETLNVGATPVAFASGVVVASALANGTIGSASADGTVVPNTYMRLGAGVGQAFLADIARNANPFTSLGDPKAPDTDSALGLLNAGGAPADPTTTYDDELLDAHFVAGDARVNENIVLSSIHEVFHNAHNQLVTQIEEMIAQREQIEPGFTDLWTGEMIFEAAKLANEMQYHAYRVRRRERVPRAPHQPEHRRHSPNIQVEINPNITTEFSQAIFRLGHSMLTDSVDAVSADSSTDPASAWTWSKPSSTRPPSMPSVPPTSSRACPARRATMIDEFVVDSVRNLLVGLPLDLAAINIARGRDVGLQRSTRCAPTCSIRPAKSRSPPIRVGRTSAITCCTRHRW